MGEIPPSAGTANFRSPRRGIKSAWKSHFCCPQHRMAHNKYGKLPFEKIMLALRSEITKQVEARTLADWTDRLERIVESRIQARKREMESYIRQTVARFVKDPAKALRELDAVEAGVSKDTRKIFIEFLLQIVILLFCANR